MSRIKFEELLFRSPGQSVVSRMQMLKKWNILKILLPAKTYLLVISTNLRMLSSKPPALVCNKKLSHTVLTPHILTQ